MELMIGFALLCIGVWIGAMFLIWSAVERAAACDDDGLEFEPTIVLRASGPNLAKLVVDPNWGRPAPVDKNV